MLSNPLAGALAAIIALGLIAYAVWRGFRSNRRDRALVEAFERAGLEFILESGGGAGIRFRERASS